MAPWIGGERRAEVVRQVAQKDAAHGIERGGRLRKRQTCESKTH